MKKLLIFLFFTQLSFASYSALLFNGNCVTCHKINQSVAAPSILEIQENYKRAYPKKKEFIKSMSQWVLKPKKQTSIMQESINKYELMPELGYQKDVLEIIASYLYDTDFKKEENLK